MSSTTDWMVGTQPLQAASYTSDTYVRSLNVLILYFIYNKCLCTKEPTIWLSILSFTNFTESLFYLLSSWRIYIQGFCGWGRPLNVVAEHKTLVLTTVVIAGGHWNDACSLRYQRLCYLMTDWNMYDTLSEGKIKIMANAINRYTA